MERILNLVFTAENVRMLVLLAFGFSGYALINSKMDRMEYSLNRRIDNVEISLNKRIDDVEASLSKQMYELKHNDIAHLNNSMEALTYALEKNGSLKKSDKEYVDSRLAH